MSVALSVSLEPGLQHRVSPQLVVHSALLELTTEELEEKLLEEAERNPALEVVRRVDEGAVPLPSSPGKVVDDEDEAEPWWDRIAAPQTGRDDILLQFRAVAPPELHAVGEVLISALDARGYLKGDLEELAEAAGATLDQAQQALYILQHLDPPGLGARDLAECLLAQLEVVDTAAPPRTREFIAYCLHSGPAQMAASARRLGLSRKQLEEILEFIRENLHPYPANLTDGGFDDGPPPAAQPDVIVSREGARFVVNVPLSHRLEVRLDALYQRIAEQLRYRRNLVGHEERVRQNVRAARELIGLLQRRVHTIAAVAEAIVRFQADYFITQDPETLRPLDQKDIAELTGLHESTVCRAVKGKHMLLPDGTLVPMEMFFDDAAPARAALLRVIRHEPPDRPYSDKRLAEMLTQLGYPIARRTVTKYRAQLGIPPAHRRKRARSGR